ncbi:(4Fe-4S)-binding protein [Enterococcus faecium]|uniref:(4Fe-4S)-binding protein n=1 Tax=Enterococcus faecium TaxID=1352 RepID=UPI0009BE8158|nr:(4Fe-4S)-binding protein [Enterococcus faecium]OQO64478.1 hypothetical protein BH743_12035 [Enterococcus faecium]
MLEKEILNEETLQQLGYRKYTGKSLDVYYNKDVCIHSGNCVRGNSKVFEVNRRPWILLDDGVTEEVMSVIHTCPSGALKYIKKDV